MSSATQAPGIVRLRDIPDEERDRKKFREAWVFGYVDSLYGGDQRFRKHVGKLLGVGVFISGYDDGGRACKLDGRIGTREVGHGYLSAYEEAQAAAGRFFDHPPNERQQCPKEIG